MTTTTSTATLSNLLSDVRVEARRQGYTGTDAEFEYSEADLDYVTGMIGRKPTAEEWRAEGLGFVGSKHCA